jgi:hypothetical protein
LTAVPADATTHPVTDGPVWRPRRRATRAEHVGTVLIAVLAAGCAVVLSDAAPSGWAPADAAYRAALAVSCTLLGTRARRWTLVWAAALVTAGGALPEVVASATALVTAIAMMAAGLRKRLLGGAIGGAVAVGALTLVRPTPTGATAAIAAVALLPLLISGYRRSLRRARTATRVGLGAVALLCLVGAAGAAALGLSQRAAIESAIAESRRAVDEAGEDPDAATARFDAAAAQFETVGGAADEWWLLPARAVPVLGHHVELVRAAATAGTDLNLAAAEVATTVDADEIRAPGGGIDLAAVAAIGPEARHASERIRVSNAALSAADSPWLVPMVRNELDSLLVELDGAEDTAVTASMAAERLPHLLGGDGPRRYLLLLGNPAEARDLGGHIGNWAELVTVDGRFELVEVGAPYDLAGPTSPALELTPGAYPQSLVEMRPQYFPQNWGATADFPTVARLAAELYPQARPGAPLDGVIYADPAAFAALLQLTGDQPVAGTDVVLTPENAERFLTTGQFEVFEQELQADQAVSSIIDDTLRRFASAQLPRPTTLAEILGPVVARGGLQFVAFDPDDAALLERLDLTGEVERPGSGDVLAVLTRNANPSKIDAYLERASRYDVRWDPDTGEVEARLTVTLHNTAPEGGLPGVVGQPVDGLAEGSNRTMVSVLSPWSVDQATLDGEPAPLGTQQELRGILRHNLLVDLPPGATREVVVDLQGELGAGGVPYLLQLVGQATALDHQVDVRVERTGGSGGEVTLQHDGREDELLTVDP